MDDTLLSFDLKRALSAMRAVAHAPERASSDDYNQVVAALLIHTSAPRRDEWLDYAAAVLGDSVGTASIAKHLLAPYFLAAPAGSPQCQEVFDKKYPYCPYFSATSLFLPKHYTPFATSDPHEALLLYSLPLEEAQEIAQRAMRRYIVGGNGYSYTAEFIKQRMDEDPFNWARDRINASVWDLMRNAFHARQVPPSQLAREREWEAVTQGVDPTTTRNVMDMALRLILRKLFENNNKK